MAGKKSYEIVCVQTERPHCHITHVATLTGNGEALKRWPVKKVRKAIKGGADFYTATGGENAGVRRNRCDRCGAKTIRSSREATEENNLDELPQCGSLRTP